MQRVINRKLYDTESAEKIVTYAPNTDRGDFNYLVETLYKTSDGEYFLHGEGGAATRWAEPIPGGGKTSGASIETFSEEEAVDWCENREVNGEIIVAEFEELIEV